MNIVQKLTTIQTMLDELLRAVERMEKTVAFIEQKLNNSAEKTAERHRRIARLYAQASSSGL